MYLHQEVFSNSKRSRVSFNIGNESYTFLFEKIKKESRSLKIRSFSRKLNGNTDLYMNSL